MFAVIQKDKKQMAVHSASDLRYMLAKGWQVKEVEDAVVIAPVVEPEVAIEPVVVTTPKVAPKVVKRKYVRKNHGR